jgi:hypothetical protein
MKTNISLNRKIPAGAPLGGDILAHCACELDLDQTKLLTEAGTKELEEIIRRATDLARVAIEWEAEYELLKAQQTRREPGADDEGLAEPSRDDRRPSQDHRGYDDYGPPDEDPTRTRRLPERGRGEYRDDRRGGGGGNRNGRSGGGGGDREPRTGKQLYGWANDRNAVKWFIQFGQAEGFGARLNDWRDDDVAFALREWYRKGETAPVNGNGHRGRN